MMPVTLTLIRHGESESNRARSEWEKHRPLPRERELMAVHTSERRLTLPGRRQGAAAGRWVKDWFDAERIGPRDVRLCVSPYVRALETGGCMDLPPEYLFRQDVRLSERNWGTLDHLTYDERMAQYRDQLKDRWEHAFFWRASDGETLQDVFGRFKDYVGTLFRECSDQHVVAVCHGETMWVARYLLEYWTPQRLKEELNDRDDRVAIHNCRIIQYSREREDGTDAGKFVRVRFVDPTSPKDPSRNHDWMPIERPLFSSADLIDIAEKFPQFVDEPV